MREKSKNLLVWYLTICFTATYILNLGFWTKSGLDHSFGILILYLPGLTVLVLYLFKLRKSNFKCGDLGLSLKGFKYWILAPLSITALCFLSYGISIILNPGILKSKEEIILTLNESGFYFGHISLDLLAIALINALLGSLVGIPFYLGQELGWRAFLQPLLLKTIKPIPAFLSGGFVWGFWSFVYSGQDFTAAASPLIEGLLTILFCIPVGVLIQYFYFKSQSIFVAALAHAAFFKSIDTASQILIDTQMNSPLYGPMGIPGIAIFWALALILLIKINWQTTNTCHEKAK